MFMSNCSCKVSAEAAKNGAFVWHFTVDTLNAQFWALEYFIECVIQRKLPLKTITTKFKKNQKKIF